MSLAGRPSMLERTIRHGRRAIFDEREADVRTRLQRLAEKRDTEHRRSVRDALEERELARRYAHQHGATTGDGAPARGIHDGIHEFDPGRAHALNDAAEIVEWSALATVNELLATLVFADVTSEYSPTSEDVGVRLILVRGSRAVGVLVALDHDSDGHPDGLMHVWIAGYHRRRGLARELVDAARERFPITSIVGPLSEVRGAAKVAARLAPDIQKVSVI